MGGDGAVQGWLLGRGLGELLQPPLWEWKAIRQSVDGVAMAQAPCPRPGGRGPLV